MRKFITAIVLAASTAVAFAYNVTDGEPVATIEAENALIKFLEMSRELPSR